MSSMDTLTALDRCDTCVSAAAQVRVALGELSLDFCAHHFNKYQSALSDGGWQIQLDERSRLREENKLVGSEK